MLPLLSYSPGDGLTDGEADGLNDREAIDRSDPASPPAPHATIDVREKNKAQATIDCGVRWMITVLLHSSVGPNGAAQR